MMKKKLIVLCFYFIVIILCSCSNDKIKKEIIVNGTYTSDLSGIEIIFSENNSIRFIEKEKDYLYNLMFNTYKKEGLDLSKLAEYFRTANKNMQDGWVYFYEDDFITFWPVEDDDFRFNITIFEDGSISFMNQLYIKKPQ